ncbi:MAG: hypothetical protein ACI39R_04620, partial [Lachnospiraceae bacterium]
IFELSVVRYYIIIDRQNLKGLIYETYSILFGAVITEWNDKSSISLGMFVFVTKEPYFYDKQKNEYVMHGNEQLFASKYKL